MYFKRVLIFLLAFTFIGCSTQKRLNRKVNKVEQFAIKHNLMIKKTYRDTIKYTHITPNHNRDTSTVILYDTIVTVIDDNRIKITYKVVNDTITHYLDMKADTVYVDVPVEMEVPVIENIIEDSNHKYFWSLIIIILIIIIFRYLPLKSNKGH